MSLSVAVGVPTPSKTCTMCRVVKPAITENFEPQALGKFGLTARCRPCQKARYAELRARPDQQARQKAWRDDNKDVVQRHNAKWRAANTSTEYVAAWRAKNLEHAREQDRNRNKRRRREDPAFLLRGRISARLHTMLRGKAGRASEEILGYTCEELRRHIERQFSKGMTWAKVHAGEIEIDHITPVSSFSILSTDDPDFRVCWALSNLQPLWALDNRRKQAKRLTLL